MEVFSSNTGLSWHMARLKMKVGEPIDHKHGWSFNSKRKQNQVWKQLEKLDPEYVLITNPSPNSWKYSVFKFCLDVMKWRVDRGKGFLVIAPPDSGFAQLLTWKKLQKDRILYHIGCFNLDMTNYCRCDPSIKTCVCITIMMKTLICWNHSMPSREKGSFGLIHNGRSYHHICVHSLHTSHNL